MIQKTLKRKEEVIQEKGRIVKREERNWKKVGRAKGRSKQKGKRIKEVEEQIQVSEDEAECPVCHFDFDYEWIPM